MDTGTISDAITALGTLLLASAAIGATIAAFSGLSSWQKQMFGEHEAELARKILVLIYRHRDAISGVRNSAIWRDETEDAMSEEDRNESDDYRKFLEVARVYERRWDKVNSVRADLYPLLLEADAIWNDELKDRLEGILSLEGELVVTVGRYLRAQNPRNSDSRRKAASKHFEKGRDILYDHAEDEDFFKHEYQKSLTSVEDFLRSKFVARK